MGAKEIGPRIAERKEARPAPRCLQYDPDAGGGKWHVERFDALAADVFSMAPVAEGHWEREMAGFHAVLVEMPRQWLIARRLYGIWPLTPTGNERADDLRCHSMAEICRELRVDESGLKSELEGIGLIYQRIALPRSPEGAALASPSDADSSAQAELKLDDGVAEQLGVDLGDMSRAERTWFTAKANSWKPVFDEPMASELGAQALLTMLRMRRLRARLFKTNEAAIEYKSLQDQHDKTEERLQEQIESLTKLCPFVQAAESRGAFRQALSIFVEAHQRYHELGDTKLVDGISTALDIEVELRRSVQVPLPRYRHGQWAARMEARLGLWDSKWRSVMEPRHLKALDASFKRLAAEELETAGVKAPDLLDTGPKGEYDPLGGVDGDAKGKGNF